MPEQDASNGNGRVTTREFYEALLKQNERMEQMERRIMARLDDLAKKTELDDLHKEVDVLRDRDKVFAGINTIVALIASIIVDRLLGPR